MIVRLRLEYADAGTGQHGDARTEVSWLSSICLHSRLELWGWVSGLRYEVGNPLSQHCLAVGEDSMSLTASSASEGG
ncbi:hypothetical protein LCGC14_2229230 [marine sediment metagenome]|uniref:Uncharacterized protein n=1 Tax=marine sediment metagenome TaxID=412755 RepID=A0A0F9G3Y6_9ZZZZ